MAEPRAGVLGAAGTVIALILLTRDDWNKVWNTIFPWPLLICLATLLLGTWAYLAIAATTSRLGPNTGWVGVSDDQRRLDRVFRTLPRAVIRNVQEHDFTRPWPDELTWPLEVFIHDFDGPENEFDARRLERCRRELFNAAERFMNAVAANSHHHNRAEGFRNVGYTQAEVSEDATKLKAAQARSSAIHAAAQEFTKAHEALVRAARDDGFALYLEGDPPRSLSGPGAIPSE